MAWSFFNFHYFLLLLFYIMVTFGVPVASQLSVCYFVIIIIIFYCGYLWGASGIAIKCLLFCYYYYNFLLWLPLECQWHRNWVWPPGLLWQECRCLSSRRGCSAELKLFLLFICLIFCGKCGAAWTESIRLRSQAAPRAANLKSGPDRPPDFYF